MKSSRFEPSKRPSTTRAWPVPPALPAILSADRGVPMAILSEASPVPMAAALNTGIRIPVRAGLPEIHLGTMASIHSLRFSEDVPVLQARGQDPMPIRIWMRLHMYFAPAVIPKQSSCSTEFLPMMQTGMRFMPVRKSRLATGFPHWITPGLRFGCHRAIPNTSSYSLK